MTIECDGPIPPDLSEALSRKPWIHWIRTIERLD